MNHLLYNESYINQTIVDCTLSSLVEPRIDIDTSYEILGDNSTRVFIVSTIVLNLSADISLLFDV